MRSLKLADDGAAVEIDVGETLSVRLPENASSGHRWAPEEVDPKILELVAEEPVYSGGAGIGAGGEVTFRACAMAPGDTELAFRKWREWEGDASIVERFRVRVTVRAAAG